MENIPFLIAPNYQRFFNDFLDRVTLGIIFFSIGLIISFSDTFTHFNVESQLNGIIGIGFSFICIICYYVFFEAYFGKTPAKFLTKTHVITITGGKPRIKTCIIRSICRFIPFDFLSFFFSHHPIGWHDKLSHTIVVED